jgi:hypothetical protein
MKQDPTLRESVEAFDAWVTRGWETVKDWHERLGDIHVTMIAAVVIGVVMVICVVMLVLYLVALSQRTLQYHAFGYPWLRAYRLVLADFATEETPSRFAATPAERETWTRDLEQQRLR